MRYDEFRALWDRGLAEAKIPVWGRPTERIDMLSMARHYEIAVEPLGRQDARPFFVTALLSWRWDALKSARTATTDEDLLREIHGREETEDLNTEQPWLRVDLRLRATLPWGQPIAMPSSTVLAGWIQELTGRLERFEPLLPEQIARETSEGLLEVLAWKGDPTLDASCDADGGLLLHGVTLEAWHALDLPRRWDDPDKVDPYPDDDLARLLAHVRGGLVAWVDCLDHLTSRSR